MGVNFSSLSVSNSFDWRLVYLRLGVKDSYFCGLVFLRLGVSNYVKGLVYLRLGFKDCYVLGLIFFFFWGLVILTFRVSFLTFGR